MGTGGAGGILVQGMTSGAQAPYRGDKLRTNREGESEQPWERCALALLSL
jgi:hypothetical protein